MSESVQKKLLRVRPPRVKITYDVETGGAIEKKELPIIVGILPDLQGERSDPSTYPPLKERSMVEIDRDNFDDVMATILPRAVFTAAKQADEALKDLLKDEKDNELTFANIDAFGPMKVIQALPSLKALYQSRSQIRELQAKAEERFASKIKELEKSESDLNQKINELVRGKQPGQHVILSDEAQKEWNEVQRKRSEVRSTLKQERKNLRKDIDSLQTTLQWTNILVMPLAIAAAGVALAFVKRKRTAAR